MVSLEEVIEAYYDCRRNKRSAGSTVEFEINYDTNCIQLWRELNDRSYKPSESIAFIVKRPRAREVFAANFRDRVVHHLIDIKLRPLLEVDFINRTFNNRKGKGTSACVEQLKQDIASEGAGAWVIKMDIKGFFMSISKSKLTAMIQDYIEKRYEGDKDWLKWLLAVVVNDHPEHNCELRSPPEYWVKLDKEKSLFTNEPDKGIPIGNLTSQLLANFYLTEFDKYVVENGYTKYGRYVDDFYIVTSDKAKALLFVDNIRQKLAEIGLRLHPDKFYCQQAYKGVEMTGVVIKQNRTYTHNRTVNNAFEAVRKLEKIRHPEANGEKMRATVNAYLGFLSGHNEYGIRRNLIDAIDERWWKIAFVENRFKKVTLKKGFTIREIIKIKIKRQQALNKRKRNGKNKADQREVRSDS